MSIIGDLRQKESNWEEKNSTIGEKRYNSHEKLDQYMRVIDRTKSTFHHRDE